MKTRSSLYEILVLKGDVGNVLVRGGQHFQEFRRVIFIGSMGVGGALEPNCVEIGRRMGFHTGDRLLVTSPVHSVSRRFVPVESAECVAVP